RSADPDEARLRPTGALEPRQDLPERAPRVLTGGAKALRVIGIDPGTRHLGWGVVERQGSRTTHIAHGVVDTDETRPLCDRLVEIAVALAIVIAAHAPTAAAVEGISFAKDAPAAAKLGHARGIVLLRLARAG